jgi:uncharacterized protein
MPLLDVFLSQSLLHRARSLYRETDPAHDFTHILRVCRNARLIGEEEGADMQTLMLAALLHDAGSGTKHPENPGLHEAIRQKTVGDFLKGLGIPQAVSEKVLYAVESHRFSKGIVPVTLEAEILQDADRLDAMGAIGIARVFLTGGALNRPLYKPSDPFCRSREPDDRKWNLDHFYSKLLKLESGMHTGTGRRLAAKRAQVLKRYLKDLEDEIENEE